LASTLQNTYRILDDDHKEIVRMILSLIDTADLHAVTQKLEPLKAKFTEHFEAEEAIMSAIAYPYLEYHNHSHFHLSDYLNLIQISSSFTSIKFMLKELLTQFARHADLSLHREETCKALTSFHKLKL
jgi:hemerythrin-like metal-binding protein